MCVKYLNGKYNVSVYLRDEGKFKYVNMPEESYCKILTTIGTFHKPPRATHNLTKVRSFVLNRTSGYFIINVVSDCFEVKYYIKECDDNEYFKSLEIL